MTLCNWITDFDLNKIVFRSFHSQPHKIICFCETIDPLKLPLYANWANQKSSKYFQWAIQFVWQSGVHYSFGWGARRSWLLYKTTALMQVNWRWKSLFHSSTCQWDTWIRKINYKILGVEPIFKKNRMSIIQSTRWAALVSFSLFVMKSRNHLKCNKTNLKSIDFANLKTTFDRIEKLSAPRHIHVLLLERISTSSTT